MPTVANCFLTTTSAIRLAHLFVTSFLPSLFGHPFFATPLLRPPFAFSTTSFLSRLFCHLYSASHPYFCHSYRCDHHLCSSFFFVTSFLLPLPPSTLHHLFFVTPFLPPLFCHVFFATHLCTTFFLSPLFCHLFFATPSFAPLPPPRLLPPSPLHHLFFVTSFLPPLFCHLPKKFCCCRRCCFQKHFS